MKIKAHKNIFLKALSRVQGIVEKNSIKPITSNALLETTKEGLCVSATNLQIGMRAHYKEVAVVIEGKISVNARKFFEIIKEMPEEEIIISEKENFWIEIESGKDIKFKVIGLPPEDFPMFISENKENFVEWKTEKFIESLSLTSFSISRDETKQNISGSFLENIESKKTRIVSTDGYRLSIIDENLGSPLTLEEGIIIPHKAVLEINKLLLEKRAEKSFFVLCEKNSLFLKIAEIEIFIRLIEKKFPDYKIIIPGDAYNKAEAFVKMDKIKPTLKRMSIISNENNRPVVFSFKGKQLEIFAEDSELGNVKETIETEEKTKTEFSFCINCSYLLDILNVLEDDIKIEFNNEEENKPIIIKPLKKKEQVKYIIMPMVMD